jgi:hypothetical protein
MVYYPRQAEPYLALLRLYGELFQAYRSVLATPAVRRIA